MTNGAVGRRKKRARAALFRRILPTAGVLFCMALFLRDPALSGNAVRKGLELAAKNLIPAVFPFLVLSDLLLSAGGIPAWSTLPFGRLLRLPAAGAQAVLLGWLCGFPVGAQCAIRALEDGALTRSEAERAIAAASVPSPAFLLGAVGMGLFRDRTIGLFTEGAVLLAALLICRLSGLFSRDRCARAEQTAAPAPRGSFAERLTLSIRKAASVALNLTAFVVFFAAVSAAAGAVLTRFGAGEDLCAALVCLLELSGGTAGAAALPDPRVAFLLTVGAAGWSGLSVCFQIASVCEGSGARMGRYLLFKSAQCLLCVCFAALFLLVFRR